MKNAATKAMRAFLLEVEPAQFCVCISLGPEPDL